MRHQRHRRTLGRIPDQRKALLRSLAREFFVRGKIQTTVTRAKATSQLVEKLITLAKRGDLTAHRKAVELLPDRTVIAPIFRDAAARFGDRECGFTRVTRIGLRRGDAADLAMLQFVS